MGHRLGHRLVGPSAAESPSSREADDGSLLAWDAEPSALLGPAERQVVEESLRIAAAAEDLPVVIGGRSAAGRNELLPFVGSDASNAGYARLLADPTAESASATPPVVARFVPQITEIEAGGGHPPHPLPLDRAWVHSGAYRLRPDVAPGAVIHRPVFAVDRALAHLPPIDGRPTALFLLPFLAVGGAERLLFDLLEGWSGRYRLLVVTTEPHRAELGQTVDRCRQITPHVFCLGDQAPREALLGALTHLLRRYRVATLVSWNGTVFFYDSVAEIRRRVPDLRILHQLYHHSGGWAARTSPAVLRAVDGHLAVNGEIARSLVERGAADDQVAVVHHAVEIPPQRSEDVRRRRRRERREELGLPADDETIVLGTFIRLHPQKRPLDILRLARRFEDQRDPPVHFLLVGGGPLDDAVDRELARRPAPNLLRLPLHPDPRPYYDALDLCLMTSSYEGLPVFLLDGLARGLPGVAPALGEIPLLFSAGEESIAAGLTVERPGDLDGLEAAIRRYLDADLRRRAGDAGRRRVAEHFGLDAYRRRYEELIFPGAGEDVVEAAVEDEVEDKVEDDA